MSNQASEKMLTHNICEFCWLIVGDKPPVRMKFPYVETCCWCGEPNNDGIYLRGARSAVPDCHCEVD